MSISRKAQTFSDFNFLFGINPFTKDIQKKTDEEAIKASVKHLIQTRNYERPFHPEIGCQIYGLLFELFDPINVEIMKRSIENVITAFEPRVKILDVRVREKVDSNEITVTVEFKIINSENPLTITTAISRAR